MAEKWAKAASAPRMSSRADGGVGMAPDVHVGPERHLVVGSARRRAMAVRARSRAHAMRSGSAPTANVIRSTVRAAKAMTFGPDAAMSIGTGGCVARSSQRSRLG